MLKVLTLTFHLMLRADYHLDTSAKSSRAGGNGAK